MKHRSTIAATVVLIAAVACGESANNFEPRTLPSAAKGAPGGGGAGGGGGGGGGGVVTPPVTPPAVPAPAPSGGAQIPPSGQTDGPAWFFASFGTILSPTTANINFDAMQNLSAGGITVGTTRMALELVYNVSKKTALTITNIAFVGANPADFSIPQGDITTAAAIALPANKGAADQLHISFTPTGEGPRSATLLVTSAAGVAEIFLTGTGLPQRPVLAPFGPLDFITNSAPANMMLQNTGGATLAINSVTIGGANPSAFTFSVANNGFGNCFPGVLLAPKSLCFMEIGIVPGLTAPAKATLIIRSNDPVNPELDVVLTFTP